MVRVGRVLLVLLFATTLLATNQIGPKTEIAEAQSQQNLTVIFQTLKLAVRETDASIITYDQSGRLANTSSWVYFNGVTVKNTSSSTIYFRAIFEISTSNGFRNCLGIGGCAGPPAMTRIDGGQTVAIADNYYGESMAQPTEAGWAAMALAGVNTMDLKVTLKDNYGDTRGTGMQNGVLKWVAARIKLTQNNQPFTNVYTYLTGGGNNYNTIRGGRTDANGQVGLALLERPVVTESLKRDNGNGSFQTLKDVPINNYDFIDLTVPVDGKPDLVPDLTNIEIEMVDTANVTTVKRPPGIVFGRDIKKMTTKGIVIKNQGEAAFNGNLTIGFRLLGEALNDDPTSLGEITQEFHLEPNQSKTLDPMPFLFGEGDTEAQRITWEQMKALTVKNGKTSFDYVIVVDPHNAVAESHEDNNRASITDFMVWGAIKSIAKFNNGKPAPRVKVIFFPENSPVGTLSDGSSYTNQQGVAWFVPTKRPPVTYDVSVKWGGNLLADAPTKFAVAAPGIQTMEITVKDIYGVEADVYVDIGKNANPRNPFVPSEGKITIASVDNPKQKFSADIVQGVAIFDTKNNPTLSAGKYKPVPNDHNALKAQMNYYSGDKKVGSTTWFWPEESRASEFKSQVIDDPSTIFDFTSSNAGVLEMVLPKNCDSKTYTGLEVCTYDSSVGTTINAHPEIIKAVATTIFEMDSWKLSPAKVNKFIVGIDPALEFSAAYDPLTPNSIIVNSINAIASPSEIQTITIHETFHHLDDYYEPEASRDNPLFLSNNRPSYGQRLQEQFASDTGRKLWDIVDYNCSYTTLKDCSGYPARIIKERLDRGRFGSLGDTASAYIESFAEDRSTLCTYKSKVVSRINNVNNELTNLWQTKYKEPLPSDYPTVRDSVLARWAGKDGQGNIAIQQFSDWQQNCVSNGSR